MIQGIVLLIIVAIAVTLFILDLIYPLIDPRIAYEAAEDDRMTTATVPVPIWRRLRTLGPSAGRRRRHLVLILPLRAARPAADERQSAPMSAPSGRGCSLTRSTCWAPTRRAATCSPP